MPGAGMIIWRFLRPAAAAALAADEPPATPPSVPPTTGAAPILLVPKKPVPLERPPVTPLATLFVCAVAVVTTGLEMMGTCDTAKSGPERPVCSYVDPCVSKP